MAASPVIGLAAMWKSPKQSPGGRRWSVLRRLPSSAVVGIPPFGSRQHRKPGNDISREHPRARARSEAGREDAIVDLPCDCETVEAPRHKEDAGVVALGTVRIGRIDIAFSGGDDAVAVGVD